MSDEFARDILRDAEERMKGAVQALTDDLNGIRTGRASSALVDRLPVEYYGTPTPLNQLATIAVPEPQLITIRPFDPGSLNDITKAIQSSELGLTPNNDGKIIRLAIPALTEDRRKELVKVVFRIGLRRWRWTTDWRIWFNWHCFTYVAFYSKFFNGRFCK